MPEFELEDVEDAYTYYVSVMGISEDIYTPLIAIARVPGWCAHRVEEVIFANRIIRPAYKYLGVRQKYKPIEER